MHLLRTGWDIDSSPLQLQLSNPHAGGTLIWAWEWPATGDPAALLHAYHLMSNASTKSIKCAMTWAGLPDSRQRRMSADG